MKSSITATCLWNPTPVDSCLPDIQLQAHSLIWTGQMRSAAAASEP